MTDPSATKKGDSSASNASNGNPSQDDVNTNQMNASNATEPSSDQAIESQAKFDDKQDDNTSKPTKVDIEQTKASISIHDKTKDKKCTTNYNVQPSNPAIQSNHPANHHSHSIPMEPNDKNDTLHSITFNQDGGCLAVGTGSGFRICNVYPFHETFRRELTDGGCEGGELLGVLLLLKG